MKKGLQVVFVLLAGAILLARGVWEKKPYTEWSLKEALKIYNDSAWVVEKRFRGSMAGQSDDPSGVGPPGPGRFPGGGGAPLDGPPGAKQPGTLNESGVGGTRVGGPTPRFPPAPSRRSPGGTRFQPTRSFFIRLQSPAVMRMALARLSVLDGRMSGEEAAHFVKTPPYDGKIVVAVMADSPEGRTELSSATPEFLKSGTYLYLKRSKTRINLERYIDPAEAGGTEGFFLFPRKKKGAEMLAEKEIRFTSKLNHQTELKAKFTLKKMVVNGILQF